MDSVDAKRGSIQMREFAVLLAISFALVAATAFSFRMLDAHITKNDQLRQTAALAEMLAKTHETIADARAAGNAAAPNSK